MEAQEELGLMVGTANGGVHIGISKVECGIERTKFQANIGFSRDIAVSFNILGREGIFSKFSICFNERMKTVILVPVKGMPA